MPQQRNSEESVQEEIKEEDRRFLTGGIVFIIGLILVLIIGGLLLLRLVILPVFRSTMNTISPQPTPTVVNASPAPAGENTPVVKDINAIPYNWQRVDIPEVGTSVAVPPEATVSASGNTAAIKIGETTIQFAQKSITGSDLEDEAERIRNKLNNTSTDTTLVEKTDVAAITAYAFTAEKPPKDQHILLAETDTRYVEIIIPDLHDDAKLRSVVDDVLASIRLIEDKTPLSTK